MSRLRIILCACLLAPTAGCESVRDWLSKGPRPGPNPNGTATAVPRVNADQLVGYLNAQAGRLQNISFGEATVSASEGDGLRGVLKDMVYPTLRGNLSASQPRYFRMAAGGGAASVKVDLGSNPDKFWVYFTAPTMQPMFVFASHTDFEAGTAKVPGNMPVDPDWIMQALGMTTFTPGPQYTVTPDERARTYTLGWPATLPSGTQVRKEIVFAVDDVDAGRNQPQVRRHLIRDTKGNIVCSAEIKSARTVPVGGTDPVTKRPFVVQYPTEVEMRWVEQKFRMTLKLDAAKLNQQLTPEDIRRLFELPNIAGATPVDLAHARYDVMGK